MASKIGVGLCRDKKGYCDGHEKRISLGNETPTGSEIGLVAHSRVDSTPFVHKPHPNDTTNQERRNIPNLTLEERLKGSWGWHLYILRKSGT